MRLDHLLSKEHMADCERMTRTVAHGWNVDYLARFFKASCEYCFGVESMVVAGIVSGTLLGI